MMIFNVGLVLVVVSIIWADLHFLLGVFRAGHWWDGIPLFGMAIVTYGMGWVFASVWGELDVLRNLLVNMGTLLNAGTRYPRGREFISRMMLPPDEFERVLND